MDEQTTATIYEPPALVEVGEFGEDTLGGYLTEEEENDEAYTSL